jgi:GT2 family glycosyltransferase
LKGLCFLKKFMLISVVILNWNRKKDTLNCLESLQKAKCEFELEIIVVDNASSDGSVSEIKKFFRQRSKRGKIFRGEIIKNKENLGFCKGNNIGIDHALNHGADFVLLLNNDTFVEKDFLVNLIGTAFKHPKGGVFSPKIYFAPGYEFKKEIYKDKDVGKVIWYAGGDLDWKNVYGTNCGVDNVDHGQFDKVKQTDFATGACMLLRKEVLRDVGSLDKKYFMYFEDADLSIRAKRKGWGVIFVPDAKIWHKVSQSSGIGGPLNDYFITRNRLLFGIRYASLRTRFALYRESLRLLKSGRKWQKKGVVDFYFGKFEKGSWR